MQARYQHPATGRFLSIDPVSFLQDGRTGMVNRYSYTLNDPVNMYDPDGEFGIFGALVGAMAGGVGAYIASGGKADAKTIMLAAGTGAVIGTINPFASAGTGAGTATAIAGQAASRIALESGKGALASASGQVIGGIETNLNEGQGGVEAVVNAVTEIDKGAVIGSAVGAGGAGKGVMLMATHRTGTLGTKAGQAIEGIWTAAAAGVSEGVGSQIGENLETQAGEYDASGLACYGKGIDC